MLLKLIYQLRSFDEEELIAKCRQNGEETEQTDIPDYLAQLTQIKILKRRGDRFIVQPFLND